MGDKGFSHLSMLEPPAPRTTVRLMFLEFESGRRIVLGNYRQICIAPNLHLIALLPNNTRTLTYGKLEHLRAILCWDLPKFPEKFMIS